MPPLAAGQAVALKVLKEGATLQQLQREVDAISCVKHPNIVEMYDYGTDVTGRHYVVMEYLDGHTLSERCERSSRLGQVEATSVLRQLLSALTAMHPDLGEIDRARSHEVQTNSDLEVSSRARHGYIHRDIKPDNVLLVEHRGPVLIDFNISSKAGVVRETGTCTPGFVRPCVRGERWQPAHDLYGLGVTMACAIAGVMQPAFQSPLEQEAGVRDLLALAAESVGDPLLSVLRRLCSLNSAESFPDARSALAALDVSAGPSG
jgi:serine/threonine-protein kinase